MPRRPHEDGRGNREEEEMMMRRRTIGGTLGIMVTAALLATACQSTSGRTAGEWMDDKATTAKVKTALGAAKLGTVTSVDVDTVEGVVYLTGVVDSADVKRRAEEIAKNSSNGRRVVNNLSVGTDTTPSASPPGTGR
jgi:hypothetical protein